MNFDTWSREARTGTRLLSISALSVVALLVFGLGGWGVTAPLSGAVVVPGTVVADGHDQIVDHLESGIVRKIFVREGDHVSKGQPLVEMDPTSAKAQFDALQKKVIGLQAEAARLAAERDDVDSFAFPDALVALAGKQRDMKLLVEQKQEFLARLKRHHQEQSIMRQGIMALRDQIDGTEAQRAALERELAVVRDETKRKKVLLDQGLADRTQYTDLLRSEAQLVGQREQAVTNVLASKTKIAEAEEQIARLTSQRVETAVSKLNELRAKLSDAEEQLRAAADVVSRLVVRAPTDGVVVKMNVNTEGSVLKSAAPILELLPTGQHLVVEVHVSPRDIDSVKVGQAARLRFSALNARRTPTAKATVFYVSADQLIDPVQHKPYYVARLRLETPLPKGLAKSRIYPGMPVQSYITTSERTFAEYLVKPLTDSFSHAFRQD